MNTIERQREAADEARDQCVRDGRRDLFGRRYRAECNARGVDADEAPKAAAIVGCPRCNRFFPANELLPADAADFDGHEALARIDRHLADLRKVRLPNGAASNFNRAREERAGDRARDRCVDEGKPGSFSKYYAEELAKH